MATKALMSGNEASSYPKKIRLKIAGTTYVATYDVQDDCVQVTHKGRRSIWTEIGGSRPEVVARMLLRELLGVLVATFYFAALAEHAEAVWASTCELRAVQAMATPAETPPDGRYPDETLGHATWLLSG